VPETIAKFREAGIVLWVLTGDKAETAISIAYSSNTFSTDDILFLWEFKDDDFEGCVLAHSCFCAREPRRLCRAVVSWMLTSTPMTCFPAGPPLCNKCGPPYVTHGWARVWHCLLGPTARRTS
jgi:hypothetical protein